MTPHYWKIRAFSTALQLERERSRAVQQAIEERLKDALREAGKNPVLNYRFDDDTETLTELTPANVVG
jgi:hypothetical protein